MTKTDQDYYKTLGLSQNADEKAIKEAFRKLTLKYHSDRNNSPETENRYKEIAEAYSVLSDVGKLQQYDQKRFPSFVQDTICANVFSRAKKAQRTKGQDLDIRAYVTLERIASGGDEVITVNRQATCNSCSGTGAAAGSQLKKCVTCAGSGQKVTKINKKADNQFQQITNCPECLGKGMVIKTPCPQCMGAGKIDEQEALTVKIPKGANDGMMLKLPRHGLAATAPYLPSGDLYICIESYTDPRFQRKGADLWHALTIDVTDAVLGVELKVPTLEGYAKLKIPAGTQTNEILKIKKKAYLFKAVINMAI